MARLPRLVIPGHPHHVTQRGNRRAQTFFEESDYALYKDLLSEAAQKANAEIWCYCLMPNHVHIIIVPSDERAQDWLWSSAAAHFSGSDDGLVTVTPALERYGDFAAFLAQEVDAAAVKMLRQSETTGRPLGTAKWIEKLERLTTRQLKPQKRGPKTGDGD